MIFVGHDGEVHASGFLPLALGNVTREGLAEAVAATLQVLTKLRGEVEFAPPGSLPNDGKTIADERPAG